MKPKSTAIGKAAYVAYYESLYNSKGLKFLHRAWKGEPPKSQTAWVKAAQAAIKAGKVKA